jgi:NAD(P)-dependent dehydrogenase (short-subunit alcohol dehydrogenase family)
MDLHLLDRVAVVTGAGAGIGLAITRALVAEGAHVVAGSRDVTPELAELAANGSVTALAVDLATADGPAALIAAAPEWIDVVVNNVGNAPGRLDGFLGVSDDEWQRTFELNLFAAVRTTRAALPGMLAAGAGVFVNICSVNARLPDPAVLDYSAAKAALASFSKSLSKEVAPKGVRVNTVSPGPVGTALWLGDEGVAAAVSRKTGTSAKDVAAAAAAQSVTGRFTTPEEVADLVAFLASDRAANITGADFTIDGGLITTL